MKVNWTKVYTTSNSIQAELIKARLSEDDIPVAFVNKQDSMHLHLNMQFGVELFVAKENAFQTVQIIEKMDFDE